MRHLARHPCLSAHLVKLLRNQYRDDPDAIYSELYLMRGDGTVFSKQVSHRTDDVLNYLLRDPATGAETNWARRIASPKRNE